MGSPVTQFEIEPPKSGNQFEIEPPPKKLSLYEQARASFNAKKGNVDMPGSFEGHPENIAEYVPATAGRAIEGAVDMSRGNVAMGAHKLIQAGTNVLAPMAPVMAAGAPAMALRGAVGAAAGGGVARAGASALGASEDQKTLATDIGGIVGGSLGTNQKVADTAKILARPAAKMAFEAAKDIPVVRGVIKGAQTFADVPGQLKNVWFGHDGEPVGTPMFFNQQPKALPSGPIELGPGQIMSPPSTQTPGKIIARGPNGQMKTFFTSGSVEEGTPAVQYQTPQAKASQAQAQNLTPPPYATFGRPMSGESAAMQSLPGDMKSLLAISHQRGLPIAKDATAQSLMRGIVDDLSDKELDEFEAQAAYRSKFNGQIQPSTNPVQTAPANQVPAIRVNPDPSAKTSLIQRGSAPQGQVPRVLGRDGEFAIKEANNLPADFPKVPANDSEIEQLLMKSLAQVKAKRASGQ